MLNPVEGYFYQWVNASSTSNFSHSKLGHLCIFIHWGTTLVRVSDTNFTTVLTIYLQTCWRMNKYGYRDINTSKMQTHLLTKKVPANSCKMQKSKHLLTTVTNTSSEAWEIELTSTRKQNIMANKHCHEQVIINLNIPNCQWFKRFIHKNEKKAIKTRWNKKTI